MLFWEVFQFKKLEEDFSINYLRIQRRLFLNRLTFLENKRLSIHNRVGCLMEQRDIETWQKNIIFLLDMFNKSEDPTVMGLALKYAANYFWLRNKPDIAVDFAEKSKKFIQ